jgi:hypothetical protein
MKNYLSIAVAAVLIGTRGVAFAGLASCTDAAVQERARFQFDDARESSQPPSPRRSRALEGVVETGRTPNSNPLAPPGYESRYCEGTLTLDDGSILHLFILVAGKDDGAAGFEGLETCWQDARFPRTASSCKMETSPTKR